METTIKILTDQEQINQAAHAVSSALARWHSAQEELQAALNHARKREEEESILRRNYETAYAALLVAAKRVA